MTRKEVPVKTRRTSAMTGKQGTTRLTKSTVPIEGKMLQALFDKLKKSHLDLKDEVKELCRRCSSSAELTTFKTLLLEFPPLHNLNDILQDMSVTPNMKMLKSTTSPRNSVTLKPTSDLKRTFASSAVVVAAKALKFSPHLFKTGPATSDGKTYSPNGVFELIAEPNCCKDEDDDDVIEIDGL